MIVVPEAVTAMRIRFSVAVTEGNRWVTVVQMSHVGARIS
jgi:hypothetical protein